MCTENKSVMLMVRRVNILMKEDHLNFYSTNLLNQFDTIAGLTKTMFTNQPYHKLSGFLMLGFPTL